MIYVFDTNVFRALGNFYPDNFPSIWENISNYILEGNLISVKEVYNELELQSTHEHIIEWSKKNKGIFLPPTIEEIEFIKQIFQVNHFQQLIGKSQILKGQPVADPFLIASAKVNNGCVVTEESDKENAARIPNICRNFNIECINLKQFMEDNNWQF